MKYSLLFIGFLFLTSSISAQAQPVRDGVKIETDTTTFNIEDLRNPNGN